MFDTTGRAYHVVERLLDQTRRKKVNWVKSGKAGTYETVFTNYKVELSPFYNVHSAALGGFAEEYRRAVTGELYSLRVLDNGGMIVENIDPPLSVGAAGILDALNRPDLALTQSLLKSLYDIVSANFSESRAFDEILRELDG